ncbi:MAG: efflux RND transporter periplasmic adaptor subunit [Gammaproteobacteria bacterium]|nr:efflux RND transporter periplasmic adaptor subunit [Gammaproteobacteria bacterium]
MSKPRILFILIFISIASVILYQVQDRFDHIANKKKSSKDKKGAIPVLVEPITKRSISLIKQLSGSLEAHSEFIASPKVSGIVNKLYFNLGDKVSRGEIVAILDSAEYEQAILQAEAELEVAKANLNEAQSLVEINKRKLKRINDLSSKGVSSASQLDLAQADYLASQARVKVSMAELTQAKAVLETVRIRRDYTNIAANWPGDDELRYVAERFVDAGETVDAKTPLLKIVKLNPITAVFYITEKGYSDLAQGMTVLLTTDAIATKEFKGRITRIAPVFDVESRQARVEVEVNNDDLFLKPGMFVRAEIILQKKDNVNVIPRKAISKREQQQGVFLLDKSNSKVSWQTIETGIDQDELVELISPDLQGKVVTMGQQFLKNNSSIMLAKAAK